MLMQVINRASKQLKAMSYNKQIVIAKHPKKAAWKYTYIVCVKKKKQMTSHIQVNCV